jgi:hypothetical protein
MKLTKGKVPKLLTKKKQSLKRYKKGKKQGNKRRTFRKRGSSIDLSKKTLKNAKFRMKGGDEEEGEQQEETGINNGTMEQSLASLKEMTVGDLVSYLAQEIANKTLQTTLGNQVSEEALPAAALIQSKAGEEEEQLANTQGSSVVLTPEEEAAKLAQEGQATAPVLTSEEEEEAVKLQQQTAPVLTSEEEEAAKIAEEGQATVPVLTPEEEEAAKLQQEAAAPVLTPEEEEEAKLQQVAAPVLTAEEETKINQQATDLSLEPGVKLLEEQKTTTPSEAPL